MKILFKIILFPIAILCMALSFIIGILGTFARVALGIICALFGIFFILSIFSASGFQQIFTNGLFLLIFGVMAALIELVPAFLSGISERIFEL